MRQALVRANPVNGCKAIYVGSHAWYIEGMPYEESRRLLDELTAHTTRPECVFQHRWRQWDLVMWDNRAVLLSPIQHSALSFKASRSYLQTGRTGSSLRPKPSLTRPRRLRYFSRL